MSEASTNAWDIVASSNIQNTHYTDHHDVDEDVMAICKCGGGCYSHTEAGITQRAVFHPSDFLVGYVASLENKTSSPLTGC